MNLSVYIMPFVVHLYFFTLVKPVDNREYYMLIKGYTFIVMQVTMTSNVNIRETDKNRRA